MTLTWISEAPASLPVDPGCYPSMNREPGATPSVEIVHECGGNDWTCPVGVALELEQGEAEIETADYDGETWDVVQGPTRLGYYRLTRNVRVTEVAYTATGKNVQTIYVHGATLGLPTTLED